MNLYKSCGLTYAQHFLDMIVYDFVDYTDLGCSVEGFNNGREQGYIIRVHREGTRAELEKGLTFYVYNQRNSDEPTITWEDKETFAPLYSEEAWIDRTFSAEHIEDVIDKAEELINEKLEKEG